MLLISTDSVPVARERLVCVRVRLTRSRFAFFSSLNIRATNVSIKQDARSQGRCFASRLICRRRGHSKPNRKEALLERVKGNLPSTARPQLIQALVILPAELSSLGAIKMPARHARTHTAKNLLVITINEKTRKWRVKISRT